MADISKMNVNGTEYNIKDATARAKAEDALIDAGNAQTSATKANNDIATFCYECERNVSTDGNPCCILERSFLDTGDYTYGISEMIFSGYIKWTENGTEQVGRFSMDITRAVQGVDGSATTYLAGTTVAHGSFIPKMFTLKVVIQKPFSATSGTNEAFYPKHYDWAEHGLAFIEARVSDGSTSQAATVSSLKVRTILFRILEQK